ncbi:Protein of uncharacterised function (DUF497) [Actinobacillus ureae]|uniref:BrnT family toxin n=1 Tax=Actinobacillus ureae TaxID=723 RepID=UPI000E18BC7D|nr:BrnT family toxin [Actinobacillus ureae]SUT86381.1 Protein of uncharacterised function (DUF497) [Actinobacillus ureae]SUU45718.1 Protein of uncharacterised function (DUF497) [Actinobacillus ureae]
MKLEYDEQKSLRNEQERGLPFSVVEQFDFETAYIRQDTRFEYPEPRFKALGLENGRIHTLVFCTRGKFLRVISFRKANSREVKVYEINRR